MYQKRIYYKNNDIHGKNGTFWIEKFSNLQLSIQIDSEKNNDIYIHAQKANLSIGEVFETIGALQSGIYWLFLNHHPK